MAKFTGGDWHYEQDACGEFFILSDCETVGNYIACTPHGSNGDDDVQLEANARLISKAPEMYELISSIEFDKDDNCMCCGRDLEHMPDCIIGNLLKEIEGE